MANLVEKILKQKLFLLFLLPLFFLGCGNADNSDNDKQEVISTSTTQTVPLNDLEEIKTLSPVEIYDQISPSIVYVDTPSGTGSGILLQEGFVLTNAHVVSLHSDVRVWTADGNHSAAPVYARDWIRDLALVGPLSTNLPGLNFDTKEMKSGDQVFLIGFPGESESQPVAAITSGMVSRTRSNRCLDLDFLQTDALIAGGQSGGALVDQFGDLVGISGLGGFTEANFALVLSARNALEGLNEFELGLDPLFPALGTPNGTPKNQIVPLDFTQPTSFTEMGPAKLLLSIDEPNTVFEATVSGSPEDDVWIEITDLYGDIPFTNEIDSYDYVEDEETDSLSNQEEMEFYVDSYFEGSESIEVTLNQGSYYVHVGLFSERSGSDLEVTSSHALIPIFDPHGVIEIALETSVRGTISSLDKDHFEIGLTEGEEVRIRVDSISDPIMSVYHNDILVASNDDSGSGLYGAASEVIFTPPETGQYIISVTSWSPEIDGYVLTAGSGSSTSFCGNDWWPRQ